MINLAVLGAGASVFTRSSSFTSTNSFENLVRPLFP